MSCDIRLAAANARFGAPEIKLGWIGGGGMSYLLAHSIGPSNAALMLMTGDPIDAARALSWGLVSEVVEFSELRPRALALAQTIAMRRRSPPKRRRQICARPMRCHLKRRFNTSAIYKQFASPPRMPRKDATRSNKSGWRISIAVSACPGKVGTGFSTRTYAKFKVWSPFQFHLSWIRSRAQRPGTRT